MKAKTLDERIVSITKSQAQLIRARECNPAACGKPEACKIKCPDIDRVKGATWERICELKIL
jgi:hypothetical protein